MVHPGQTSPPPFSLYATIPPSLVKRITLHHDMITLIFTLDVQESLALLPRSFSERLTVVQWLVSLHMLYLVHRIVKTVCDTDTIQPEVINVDGLFSHTAKIAEAVSPSFVGPHNQEPLGDALEDLGRQVVSAQHQPEHHVAETNQQPSVEQRHTTADYHESQVAVQDRDAPLVELAREEEQRTCCRGADDPTHENVWEEEQLTNEASSMIPMLPIRQDHPHHDSQISQWVRNIEGLAEGYQHGVNIWASFRDSIDILDLITHALRWHRIGQDKQHDPEAEDYVGLIQEDVSVVGHPELIAERDGQGPIDIEAPPIHAAYLDAYDTFNTRQPCPPTTLRFDTTEEWVEYFAPFDALINHCETSAIIRIF